MKRNNLCKYRYIYLFWQIIRCGISYRTLKVHTLSIIGKAARSSVKGRCFCNFLLLNLCFFDFLFNFAIRKHEHGRTMPIYYPSILAACAVTSVVLSLVLIGVSIRQDELLKKYRSARWCLCAAFMAFGIANMLQATMETDGKEEALTGVMTIFIGSVQAMMFTTVALIFIRPAIVTVRRALLQITAILLVSVFLFVARFTFPLSVFYPFYYVCILGYVLLMAMYTYVFVKSYKVFKKQMLDYYEEEEMLYRMRWIKWTFWSALVVGILALLLLTDNYIVNILLTALFAAYFLFITISFINYQQYAQFIVRAYEDEPSVSQQNAEKEKLSVADVEKLRTSISEWVSKKKYAESDLSVEEIAGQFGTSSSFLRKYFNNFVGEDFRSWRNRIRIEEAKRLIDDNPSIKIVEVMKLTGFNDRPYFYRIFQKLVGVSVSEYRKGRGGVG